MLKKRFTSGSRERKGGVNGRGLCGKRGRGEGVESGRKPKKSRQGGGKKGRRKVRRKEGKNRVRILKEQKINNKCNEERREQGRGLEGREPN